MLEALRGSREPTLFIISDTEQQRTNLHIVE